jgi:hypothetical protein
MTDSEADGPLGRAISAAPPAPFGAGIPKINRFTGLSTDYLNHFTEAVMVLEMAATMPECLDDLKAWRPKTYREHFAASRFKDRDALVAAYEAADPAVREALDSVSETLNAVVTQTRDVVIGHRGTPAAEALAQRAVAWLKPLIARAASVINGAAHVATGRQAPQAAIDAIFGR